ncbi:AraC family transcriptional regulator [Novosphingobium sp. 9U]|uniref:AraC family transcriptional regulator n=1 Tax=Novosphingobium sp. 9U TaxID=2653158 RepID=UPI0012F3B402|nr:AraC family transcriptional regulator [Novosphingobium sp. 9U]VWX53450.1 DNA-binding domain-containing protein, AraC-type [Novosphingobium sp. 9U]
MPGHRPSDRSLSELLAGLRLAGRTWCYADLAAPAGLAIPAAAGSVHVHAVIHGTVRLAGVSGMQLELGAGDAVAILSGEAHALRTTAGASAEPLEFLRTPCEADVPPAFVLGQGSAISARVLSGRLSAAWPAEASPATLAPVLRLGAEGVVPRDALARAAIGAGATALLTRLADTLVVAALRSAPGARAWLSPELDDPIGEALQLIAGDPSHPWTVESLARAVGMGRSNFAAQFTQRLGQAPMEVVTARRMDAAAALLAQGKLKLAEIAELAGYGSEAAFSRRFTRHFGVTPSRHREIARERQAQPAEAPRFKPLLGRAAPLVDRPVPQDPASKSAAAGERRHAILLRQPRG